MEAWRRIVTLDVGASTHGMTATDRAVSTLGLEPTNCWLTHSSQLAHHRRLQSAQQATISVSASLLPHHSHHVCSSFIVTAYNVVRAGPLPRPPECAAQPTIIAAGVLVLGGCARAVLNYSYVLILEALAGECDGTLYYPPAD
eukprot:scaffold9905_cov117-Isochrysis_galbana.AAC.1